MRYLWMMNFKYQNNEKIPIHVYRIKFIVN